MYALGFVGITCYISAKVVRELEASTLTLNSKPLNSTPDFKKLPLPGCRYRDLAVGFHA